MKYVKTLDLNKTYSSKSYGDFVVLEDNTSRDVKIRFISTGFEYRTRSNDVKNGSVYDPYCPTKYGVGFLGEGVYHCSKRELPGLVSAPNAYYAWDGMLSRCYNDNAPEYASYGGRGVWVNECWHNFQNFAHWYTDKRVCDGYEVDKDVLFPSNLEYSPETCTMIPKYLNQGISNNRSAKGMYLLGVSKPIDNDTNRKSERYKPYVGTWKGAEWFQTEVDAHFGWMAYKVEKLKNYIQRYLTEPKPDGRVITALIDRVRILEESIRNKTVIESFY